MVRKRVNHVHVGVAKGLLICGGARQMLGSLFETDMLVYFYGHISRRRGAGKVLIFNCVFVIVVVSLTPKLEHLVNIS